jgi:electron transfer flavoprotein alpha subunit
MQRLKTGFSNFGSKKLYKMAVLVYAEADNGEIKKSSAEAVVFGKKLSEMLGSGLTVLCTDDVSEDVLSGLGNFGAEKVLKVSDERLYKKPVSATATAVAAAADAEGASVIVMAKSSLTDAVAPRVGIKTGATVASNVTEVPEIDGDTYRVTRGVYTGKAVSKVKVTGEKKVITIKKNAVALEETGGSATVEAFSPEFGERDFAVSLRETEKQEGDILLPEAERVVSAGRGLKGPENWDMIEDLAKTLTAATACSKPVSDMEWRGHHEHVGQTGIKVSPDLYIAVGISGAIQHLAGVSSSKVIVVINKDPEAPFFKNADYGIVGDAFDVVPKLHEAFKAKLS